VVEISLNRTLLAALVALIPLASFATERIISSDPQSIIFEYTPSYGLTDTAEDGGLRISLNSGDLVKVPGRPLLPVRFVTIAIPPYAKPTVRLVSFETGTSSPGRLSTYPAETSQTPQLQAIPEVLEPIGKPEIRSLGGIATLRIPLYPVRVNGTEVSRAQRMVVRVDFHAPKTARVQANSPAKLSELQRAILLNPEQAGTLGRNEPASFEFAGWPQGFLYRFTVADEALYKLSFETLKSGGVTLSQNGVPSGQVKLFGNGGMELPNNPDSSTILGLKECAIYLNDGGDGIFGPGDWLLFYGRGAGGWYPSPDSIWGTGGWRTPTDAFMYGMHHYDTENTYWFNIDPAGGGKRMASFNSAALPTRVVETVPARVHLEPERFIFGGNAFSGAGREWYAYTFEGVSRVSYTVSTPSVDTSSNAKLTLRVVGRGGGPDAQISIKVNNTLLTSYRPDYYNYTGIRQYTIPAAQLRVGYNTFLFEQTIGGTTQALFDWLELYYYTKLNHTQAFEAIVSPSPLEYRSNGVTDPFFFEITDHNNVKVERRAALILDGSTSHRRLLLADPATIQSFEPHFEAYFPPEDDIADLTSASNQFDVLLIVNDAFYETMKPLVEHYSRRNPQLRAARVRLSEIYNRFGGGVNDLAAIRNFLRFASENEATPPRYVLFCGDADYDYRNITRAEPPYFVPTWESGYEKGSLSSDDWFVDFTPEGPDHRDLLPEMATGRLTIQTTREMENIIAKIIAYDEEPQFGLWRNRITLVADDEFSETSGSEDEHVRFCEDIARHILPPTFDYTKVYLTEFQRQWGREKPAAADALVAAINSGTVIVNYFGHGNPTLWAHEHVFVQSRDMGRLESSAKLPLFVAFTCDWAYFDDPASQSFPEQLLALPEAGCIGSIASTRLTYSSSNFNIARNFFTNMYGGEGMTPGEALALAKHQAWGSVSPTYHLLGDPTLQIGSPKLSGKIERLTPSPLTPLGAAEVAVSVLDSSGNVDNTFAGEAQFVLLDTDTPKQHTVETDPPIILNYAMPGATVYRGFLSVRNGRFGGNFTVPRDVTFNGSAGRAVAYFNNGVVDGVASMDSVAYSGRAATATDTIPPQITLYFDNRAYRQGDPISSEPLVIADLSDSSGINLTGAMGHGVWLTVDGGRPVDLTESFRYSLDSHHKGSLEKRLTALEPGRHVIRVEAWDSFNNLGVLEQNVDVVDDAGALFIDRVLNFPNPFNSTTALTFRINRPADYEILIFTVNGRQIRRLTGTASSPGLVSATTWNGYDDDGHRAGNGVYLYKVIATDDDGNTAEGLGRIAFIR